MTPRTRPEPISPARLPVRSKSGMVGQRRIGRRAERLAFGEREQERGAARRQRSDLHVEIGPNMSASSALPILDRRQLLRAAVHRPDGDDRMRRSERSSSDGCRSMRMPATASARRAPPTGRRRPAWRRPHDRRGCARPRAAPRRRDRGARAPARTADDEIRKLVAIGCEQRRARRPRHDEDPAPSRQKIPRPRSSRLRGNEPRALSPGQATTLLR